MNTVATVAVVEEVPTIELVTHSEAQSSVRCAPGDDDDGYDGKPCTPDE